MFKKLHHSRSSFKENAGTFSNSSTTQENMTISRKNMLLFIKNTKNLFSKCPIGKQKI